MWDFFVKNMNGGKAVDKGIYSNFREKKFLIILIYKRGKFLLRRCCGQSWTAEGFQ